MENKEKVLASLTWKLLERSGTQGIQFIISIILARILSPNEYGVLALVMVFISLANVFIDSGFSTALIQKKNTDEIDFSSVLYFSLGISSVLYLIIFLFSPQIALFYNQPVLTSVIRVLSITLFFGSFISIQNAYIAKKMLFKKQFISSFGATVISGIVGVLFAYSGFGVWALVAQQISNQIALVVILLFTVNWRPIISFSMQRIKNLFKFGSKLLISAMIDTIYKNVQTILIGRLYTPTLLGYYNRGEQFPQLIVTNINGSIQSVMLPTLSEFQDEKTKIKSITRRAIVTSSFLILPMMIGLAVIAEPLILIVLTDKWIQAVPFLQIACITYSFWPIHTANLQAINAIGRSDIFLNLEIVKKFIGFLILIISLKFGVFGIAWGVAINSIISTFINSYPNKKLLNYHYSEQMHDIIPSLLISILMGLFIFCFKFLGLGIGQLIILQIIMGIVVYIGLAIFFKSECYTYLLMTIKQIIMSRDGNRF